MHKSNPANGLMKGASRWLTAIAVGLSLVASQAYAVDHLSCSQLVRPKIEEYDDYNTFMVEAINYKKAQRACEKFLAENPAPIEEDRPNKDKIIVSDETGLEDISAAVAHARTYEQPSYAEPLRFNRTTAQSFSLPSVRTLDMSDQYIEGAIEEESPDNTTRSERQRGEVMEAKAESARDAEKRLREFELDQREMIDLGDQQQASNGTELCASEGNLCYFQGIPDSAYGQQFLYISPDGRTGYAAFSTEFRID